MHEAHIGSDAAPTTAEAINLQVQEKYDATIRTMLKKHESICNGKLDDISVNKHSIYLVPVVRPFKSHLYCAGPDIGELEQPEIRKQLEAEAI